MGVVNGFGYTLIFRLQTTFYRIRESNEGEVNYLKLDNFSTAFQNMAYLGSLKHLIFIFGCQSQCNSVFEIGHICEDMTSLYLLNFTIYHMLTVWSLKHLETKSQRAKDPGLSL